MLHLIETAYHVQNFLESQSWRFCIIGGIAVQRWGAPRVTIDVDITIFTGLAEESPYVTAILNEFESRVADPERFALTNRILLLKRGNIGIDIALGALDFELSAIERATYHQFTPKYSLKTCSAEDLIVMKAFAARTQDWADVENIVSRQATLDWEYIIEQLAPLAEIKYEPEIIDQLLKIKKRFYQK